jgi:hypothetical protein
MTYLIIDASDDAVLAACESAQDLRPTLEHIQQEQPGREVIVVWFGDRRGDLFGSQSQVSVRTLTDAEGFALYGR